MSTARTITYERARNLILLAGLIVVSLIALTMMIRGVDPIEVVATLFYAPLFVGLLYFGLPAGIVLGVAAAVGYVLLRLPAIELVGIPALGGLLTSRIVGFLAFGAAGGWAVGHLQAAIRKLERYDEIDDDTGLGNARSLVHSVETERSRADRYENRFAVVVARFVQPDWEELGVRAQRRALRAIGDAVREGSRDSDHLAHFRDGDDHLIVAVLPETGEEGARTVAKNLSGRIEPTANTTPETEVFSYPGNPEGLEVLIARARNVDASVGPG